MSGWLYVLELAPTNCIKVGRTEDLPSRLTQHLCSTKAYGVAVTRVASFAVENPARDEARLLAALRRNRSARETGAPETFAKISFEEVVVLVADVRLAASTEAESPPTPSVGAAVRQIAALRTPDPEDPTHQEWEGSFLGDVLQALGDERQARTIAVLNRLAAHRPEIYGGWGARDLKLLLSRNGVSTMKTGGQMVVRREDVAQAVEGMPDAPTEAPTPVQAS